ncbi:MAG TPA: UDP-N-acetylmuramoyl-tripeptide--D-alanyl-D-alanine ligase [Turneriella sp.]|nr:UDP-N-acetylmuramoyl-tripeptide--D-alanyl-D-alanine ligase [Turneriella sp.]
MFAKLNYDFFTIAAVCGIKMPSLNIEPVRITSITTSSLEVKPGSLFVPLADKRDGHYFINDAIDHGAAAFFVRKGHNILKHIRASHQKKIILVDDPLQALNRLAQFHRSRFAPYVIAVTGSNGKTTTKEMLAQIFQTAYANACTATKKNYNNHIGVPFTLFSINEKTRVAIVEMGMNHAGEIASLTKIVKPHAALISSVGHAHIEFFSSRRAIAAAKGEVMTAMPHGGQVYVPQDVQEMPTLLQIAKKHHCRIRRIDKRKGFLKIEKISPQGFTLSIENKKFDFPYPNKAWVSNLALAAICAHDAGVKTTDILSAVRRFKPLDGRMQIVKGHFTLIDANPDSAIASIDAALQIADGAPVVCVFADFKELGRFSQKLHAWTGIEAAKKGVAAFYAIGSEMKHAQLAFGKNAAKSARSYFFAREDTARIIEALRAEKAGSVVLVKGSRAMKMEEIVAQLKK